MRKYMYMYGWMTEFSIERENSTMKGHKITSLLKKVGFKEYKNATDTCENIGYSILW